MTACVNELNNVIAVATHFSSFCVVLLAGGALLVVVLRLLMAFNHLDFMLPLDDDDSFLSRAFDSVASSFEANRSFWKLNTSAVWNTDFASIATMTVAYFGGRHEAPVTSSNRQTFWRDLIGLCNCYRKKKKLNV